MYVGSVAATLLTNNRNSYTGVSIDTACSMGYCAERNAIRSMLSTGEHVNTQVVAVRNAEIVMPCGVCREFMMQLGEQSKNIEFLVSLNPLKTIKLSDLLPHYWK